MIKQRVGVLGETPLTNVCRVDIRRRLSRRAMIVNAIKAAFTVNVLPSMYAEGLKPISSLRCINIVNFMRAEEPRNPCDLFQPLKEQMALIRKYDFPATWLLQYDALVEGPFVEFLKTEMPASHEIGIWFEMNRRICDDAGIAWRGNPDWEWDYHVPVAYAIGYTPQERRKLADTAMATFKQIFGYNARTIASWNLDAVSVAHLSDRYDIDAFGNCRDQLATDGFTIWGAPIAAYYPSRNNAWSPAVERKNQISTPMFRLLGQDPVYYYDNKFPYPDTMEPVWPSGQSDTFVDRFLDMLAYSPAQSIAYAQLGQENSFGWPMMRKAYPMQLEKLSKLHNRGALIVETMGKTGRRFKHSFKSTPTQAQVMLSDPFGNEDIPERSVWYQSKYYRGNLHFQKNQFYLRDLHVYDDRFPQPYLEEAVRRHGIEQRMLAVLDGYHWSDEESRAGRDGTRAMGLFMLIGQDGKELPAAASSIPIVKEMGSALQTNISLSSGGTIQVLFLDREIEFSLVGELSHVRLGLRFEWAPTISFMQKVSTHQLYYRFHNFDYSVRLVNGIASRTDHGVRIAADSDRALRLIMAQRS